MWWSWGIPCIYIVQSTNINFLVWDLGLMYYVPKISVPLCREFFRLLNFYVLNSTDEKFLKTQEFSAQKKFNERKISQNTRIFGTENTVLRDYPKWRPRMHVKCVSQGTPLDSSFSTHSRLLHYSHDYNEINGDTRHYIPIWRNYWGGHLGLIFLEILGPLFFQMTRVHSPIYATNSETQSISSLTCGKPI